MLQSLGVNGVFVIAGIAYTVAVSATTFLLTRRFSKRSGRQSGNLGEERPGGARGEGECDAIDESSPQRSVVAKGPCKLVLLVRSDVGMGKGKMCAQCGHAAVAAVTTGGKNGSAYLRTWQRDGQPKIAVKVDGDQLEESLAAARAAKLPHGRIRDAGRTQVDPGTVTVGYIGPCPVSDVDLITRKFPLL